MIKKLLITLCVATSYIFSQTGAFRNTDGLRVPSASTLKQGFIFISGNYESIGDESPMAMGGFLFNEKGESIKTETNTLSLGGSFQLSYGALDYLELGLYVPIYYDGVIDSTDFKEAGLGDIQFSVKASLPTDLPIIPGLGFEVFTPTGKTNAGFRPRHIWYIPKEGYTEAYTSGNFATSVSLYLTVNIFSIIKWNNYVSYLKNFANVPDAILWGTGLNFFHEKLISFNVEFSGETRLKKTSTDRKAINDPMRITPSIKLNLPRNLDLTFGVDIGIDYFRKVDIENGHQVLRESKKQDITYTVAGSPKVAIVFGFSKTFDFSWTDNDRDGVPDRLDMCPNSQLGVIVNVRGCPVDQDQDGVLNIVDDCPDTPLGVKVDFSGCPLDEDQDGVPDYIDQCPQTPKGMAVNAVGCMLDSDNDGVDDNNDKCPGTLKGDAVDADGCSLDEDHDGVLNTDDACPQTPAGWAVNALGCPLDDDEDGVPNEMDKCPNSEIGEIVTKDGCPLDSDKDGVPDSKDKCSDTPLNYPVDKSGCPLDSDNDGVPDALDLCPKTPANAIVDSVGCVTDNDWDGVADYLDLCPETFPNIEVDSKGCPKNSNLNLNVYGKRIKFAKNSSRLLESSFTALNDIIMLMRQYKFVLEVSGNLEKIKSIADFFEAKGFENDKIKLSSKNSEIQFKALDIQYNHAE